MDDTMNNEKKKKIDCCPDDGPNTAATAASAGEKVVVEDESLSNPSPSSTLSPNSDSGAAAAPSAASGPGGGGGMRNVHAKIGGVVKDAGMTVQKGFQQADKATKRLGEKLIKLRSAGEADKQQQGPAVATTDAAGAVVSPAASIDYDDDDHDDMKQPSSSPSIQALAKKAAITVVDDDGDECDLQNDDSSKKSHGNKTVETTSDRTKDGGGGGVVPIMSNDMQQQKPVKQDDSSSILSSSSLMSSHNSDIDTETATLATTSNNNSITRQLGRFQAMMKKKTNNNNTNTNPTNKKIARFGKPAAELGKPAAALSPPPSVSDFSTLNETEEGDLKQPLQPTSMKRNNNNNNAKEETTISNNRMDNEAAASAADNHAADIKAVVVPTAVNTTGTETTTTTSTRAVNNEPPNSNSNNDNKAMEYHSGTTSILTVCTLVSLAVACFQTWRHWSICFPTGENGESPAPRLTLSVAVAWMVCAYAAGSAITMATMVSMTTTTTTTTTMTGSDKYYSTRKSRRKSIFGAHGVNNNTASDEDDDDDERDDVFLTARSWDDIGGDYEKKNATVMFFTNIWFKITPSRSRNKPSQERQQRQQQKKPKQRKPKPCWTMLSCPNNDDKTNKNKRRWNKRRHMKLPKWQRSIDPLQCTLTSNSTTTDDDDDDNDDDSAFENHDQNIPSSSRLIQKLLSDRDLQHLPRRVSTFAPSPLEVVKDKTSTTFRVGCDFTKSTVTPQTLDDVVIEPILKLRGIDVFTNPNADEEIDESLRGSIGSHPWFIQHGLRSVPTLIINIMLSWGNLIIYFEMPEWLTDFTDALVEKPDDEPDVKALKRFLKANDEYRNERLKCIPSLVTGPLAVKILAPPKREVAIHGSVIPLSWKCHEADDQYELPEKTAAAACNDDDNDDDDDDGSNSRALYPALECELDCLSGRTIRSMSGIIKRNLSSVILDTALVIGAAPPPTRSGGKNQPDNNNDDNDNDDDNLQACLGMWRFNRIDIDSCPEFPSRSMYQDVVVNKNPTIISEEEYVDVKNNHLESSSLLSHRRADILMASRIVGLDSEELKKILAEV